ncbi:MAG: glutathione peroxidase [Bacteroidales bacterium]|nr:glutathione peroxidase [Bacteroidales bacterium]MCF8334191.1 glutathione peroxidase [Bacteroidales bacterium]
MKIFLISIVSLFVTFSAISQESQFYNFEVTDIEGNDFELSQLKGKKVLVVNTASKCGFTPQYEGLQALYEKFGGEDFTIIGFPANNFKNQEPGTDEEIKEFCKSNYGVTFPMMSKISVKGDDIHPLYEWLTKKENNGTMDAKVKWNFQKFMINEKGEIDDVAYSRTKPMDDKIVNWIKSN